MSTLQRENSDERLPTLNLKICVGRYFPLYLVISIEWAVVYVPNVGSLYHIILSSHNVHSLPNL